MTVVLENKSGNRVQFTISNSANIKGSLEKYRQSGHKIIAINY